MNAEQKEKYLLVVRKIKELKKVESIDDLKWKFAFVSGYITGLFTENKIPVNAFKKLNDYSMHILINKWFEIDN